MVLSARRGQRGQGTTSIGRVLYVERLTAGSTATTQFFCDLPSKSLCQACWATNLSRRGELSFGWPRKWPISNEKWVVHFENTSNRQLVSNTFFHFEILNYIKFMRGEFVGFYIDIHLFLKSV